MPSAATIPSSTAVVDLEAQFSLPAPTPVLTHVLRSSPSQNSIDALYALSSSRTHESRHDLSITNVPPPYVDDDLPPYSEKAPEPLTLAKYLFMFGFLFPPFWIMGAWILWSPLQAPSCDGDAELAWMPEKTEAERKKIIEEIRAVEVRWALRCLWSLLILALLGTIGGLAAWAILHSH